MEKLGCKVITYSSPVTILNGMPMVAKVAIFNNMNVLSNSNLVKNTKDMHSYIFMCDNSGLDEDIKDKTHEEASSVILRYFYIL